MSVTLPRTSDGKRTRLRRAGRPLLGAEGGDGSCGARRRRAPEISKVAEPGKEQSRLRIRSRLADLSRQHIWGMMRLTFDDRRLKVSGISPTLQEGSMSIGALTASVEAGATPERRGSG